MRFIKVIDFILMYYNNTFSNKFVENKFQSILRSDNQDKSSMKLYKNFVPKQKLNYQQAESSMEIDESFNLTSLQRKYEKTIENSKNEVQVVNIPKRKKAENKSICIGTSYIALNNQEKVLSPSEYKKIQSCFGSNPIEVLDLSKQKMLSDTTSKRLEVKANRVRDYMGSQGMKVSLETDSNATPVLNETKITTTPKSVITRVKPNTTYNRKKQVTAYDDKQKKGFYYC